MTIRNILIAVILSFTAFAQAQVTKESFDKSVDIVNYKSVELSLKNSLSKGSAEQFTKDCNCLENPEYKKIKSTIPASETKTIELSAEIEKVKTIEDISTKSKDDVIKVLSDNIFSNQTKYKKLYDFASRRKGDKSFLAMQEDLKKVLVVTLIPVQPNSSTSTQIVGAQTIDKVSNSDLEERIIQLEHKSNPIDPPNWLSRNINTIVIISFVFSLISLILIVFIGFFPLSNTPQNDASSTYESIINKILSGRRFGDHIQSELNRRINTREIVRDVVRELKPILPGLIDEYNKSTVIKDIPQQDNLAIQELKKTDVKVPIETFFLSTPNLDGSFNESSALISYKEGASIYRFTKTGNNTATFQIDDREASVKLALQYPDKNIDPVCEAVNAFNPKARRIVTVGDGRAELFGDKWMKIVKAKIRYEN